MQNQLGDPFLIETAETFWKESGRQREWPRDMESAIVLSPYPLTVVKLSCLSIEAIEKWLEDRKAPYKFPCANRDLHGCLLVYRGKGFVFVDEADDASNQRFTLAHEVSHFILDYHLPRQRARSRLGDSILEVLDGRRPSTLEERVGGILKAVSTKPEFHLMEEKGGGAFEQSKIWKVENRADQLAFELIAPSEAIYSDVVDMVEDASYFDCLTPIRRALIEKYGLPASASDPYARHIAQVITGGPSALSFLGAE